MQIHKRTVVAKGSNTTFSFILGFRGQTVKCQGQMIRWMKAMEKLEKAGRILRWLWGYDLLDQQNVRPEQVNFWVIVTRKTVLLNAIWSRPEVIQTPSGTVQRLPYQSATSPFDDQKVPSTFTRPSHEKVFTRAVFPSTTSDRLTTDRPAMARCRRDRPPAARPAGARRASKPARRDRDSMGNWNSIPTTALTIRLFC